MELYNREVLNNILPLAGTWVLNDKALLHLPQFSRDISAIFEQPCATQVMTLAEATW
jgi:hypothetical protein